MVEQTKQYRTHPIIEGYVRMVEERVHNGWAPHFLTFTFNQLPGSPASVRAQMFKEVELAYSRHLTRIFRNPHAARHTGQLPLWIGSPDFPVPKRFKDNYRDLAVNDGEHVHVLGLTSAFSRLKGSLSDHFDDNPHLYYGPDRPLFRIRCDPITETPEKVTRYALKSLSRGRIDAGDIVVLPRSRSELSVLTKAERAADRAELLAARAEDKARSEPNSQDTESA
jgi:hypothetical protein